MLLAFILWLQPVPLPLPLPDPEHSAPHKEPIPAYWPAVRWPLIAWFIAAELMDAREIPYTLQDPGELAGDLARFRERAAELKDAPPLVDAERFPSREDGNAVCGFIHTHQAHLETIRDLYPWDQRIHLARLESDRVYAVWDAVRDARCEYFYIVPRRMALKRLRVMLGADYYAGRLPCPIP